MYDNTSLGEYTQLLPVIPGSMNYPKYTERTPLRPIFSSRGSVTCRVAKELARILTPSSGKSSNHINSYQDFVEHIKNITLGIGECITCYDVTALLASVPVEPTIEFIKHRLEQDRELQQVTIMLVQHILQLLGFCVHNTYFIFQGQFYEQIEGAAMRSPVSPTVANLYMETFESRSIRTPKNPATFWKRNVNNTIVI